MQPDDLRSLPYLVHTNRELGLMLSGRKPLSYFAYLSEEDQPSCVVRYHRMFDRHVAAGRFVREVHKKPVPQLPNRFLDRIFYAIPSEHWRIAAMVDLIDSPGDWTEERERRFGSLLGYEDWQNDFWLNRQRQRRGDFAQRRIGFAEGQFTVPDDFDTMFQAEIEAMFYGEDTAGKS